MSAMCLPYLERIADGVEYQQKDVRLDAAVSIPAYLELNGVLKLLSVSNPYLEYLKCKHMYLFLIWLNLQISKQVLS